MFGGFYHFVDEAGVAHQCDVALFAGALWQGD
jgi:hypothetical protein